MNYKKETFYPVSKIQVDMKNISNGLKDNFSSDNYIPVSKFKRGIRNKKSLLKVK